MDQQKVDALAYAFMTNNPEVKGVKCTDDGGWIFKSKGEYIILNEHNGTWCWRHQDQFEEGLLEREFERFS